MKFLKASAAARRVFAGRGSEATMLRRLSEYWGFVCSTLRAFSAATVHHQLESKQKRVGGVASSDSAPFLCWLGSSVASSNCAIAPIEDVIFASGRSRDIVDEDDTELWARSCRGFAEVGRWCWWEELWELPVIFFLDCAALSSLGQPMNDQVGQCQAANAPARKPQRMSTFSAH